MKKHPFDFMNGPCEICGAPGLLQGHVHIFACDKHHHEAQLKGHGPGQTCCPWLEE